MIGVVNKRFDTFDVYIGRGSKWGNPFPVWECDNRADAIARFHAWLLTAPVRRDLGELVDKVVGCYCYPLACHGDVLVRMANNPFTIRGCTGRPLADYLR